MSAERSGNGADRRENGVSGSGAVSGFQKTLERERSVEWEAAERERNGERVSQNRLER